MKSHTYGQMTKSRLRREGLIISNVNCSYVYPTSKAKKYRDVPNRIIITDGNISVYALAKMLGLEE